MKNVAPTCTEIAFLESSMNNHAHCPLDIRHYEIYLHLPQFVSRVATLVILIFSQNSH